MIKNHHSFFPLTLAGVAICASSCFDTHGAVDPNQISGFGGSSSSSSSGEISSSSSSGSATGGAGGMAGSGGSGGTAGVGGGGGAGGAPCSGTQELCNGVCYDTSSDTAHCGNCSTMCSPDQTCEAGVCQLCTPLSMQACYTGPVGTENVGPCKGGMQLCAADGLSWGPCNGEVLPGTETCGNVVDEDCNGSAMTLSDCLVNTNLVARYFLDEAASGKTPTHALDSAPGPLDLPITYDPGTNQLAYTSVATGRGLEWMAANGLGVARVAVDPTKIKQQVHGKTQATIELVARVDSASGSYNRLFAIGAGGTNQFSFGAYDTPIYSFEMNNAEARAWTANFGNMGRAVFHVVINTADATSGNRIRLYVDGVLQTAVGGAVPNQNTTISLGTGMSMCLGNRDSQGRSMDGVLYYAAVYSGALSATDVQTNSTILKAWDDK